jgi:hypothetical protein
MWKGSTLSRPRWASAPDAENGARFAGASAGTPLPGEIRVVQSSSQLHDYALVSAANSTHIVRIPMADSADSAVVVEAVGEGHRILHRPSRRVHFISHLAQWPAGAGDFTMARRC